MFKRAYSPLNYKNGSNTAGRKRKRPLWNENTSYENTQGQLEKQATSPSDFFGFDSPKPIHPVEDIVNKNPVYSSGGIINENDAVFNILSQSTLIIERKIEYMNLFLGFEQANNYALYNSMGQQIGWLVERDFGLMKAIMRQIYRLHRPFIVDVLDLQGNHLLTIKRPFSFINSHIKAILPRSNSSNSNDDVDGTIVGESVQSWHLWRRRYNLFRKEDNDEGMFKQFGKIDSGFLRWEFPVFNKNGLINGAVSRDFSGLFREFLTDTGVYVLRMDPVSFRGVDMTEFGQVSGNCLTLDEKAVMLANAVSIDFDYFSRHSGAGGGGFLFFGGGDDI